MHVEEGHWTLIDPLYDAPDGVFRARACMTPAETNIHAPDHRQTKPCLEWCSDTFGHVGWSFQYTGTYRPPADHDLRRLILYFASCDDAIAFMMRWG